MIKQKTRRTCVLPEWVQIFRCPTTTWFRTNSDGLTCPVHRSRSRVLDSTNRFARPPCDRRYRARRPPTPIPSGDPPTSERDRHGWRNKRRSALFAIWSRVYTMTAER